MFWAATKPVISLVISRLLKHCFCKSLDETGWMYTATLTSSLIFKLFSKIRRKVETLLYDLFNESVKICLDFDRKWFSQNVQLFLFKAFQKVWLLVCYKVMFMGLWIKCSHIVGQFQIRQMVAPEKSAEVVSLKCNLTCLVLTFVLASHQTRLANTGNSITNNQKRSKNWENVSWPYQISGMGKKKASFGSVSGLYKKTTAFCNYHTEKSARITQSMQFNISTRKTKEVAMNEIELVHNLGSETDMKINVF